MKVLGWLEEGRGTAVGTQSSAPWLGMWTAYPGAWWPSLVGSWGGWRSGHRNWWLAWHRTCQVDTHRLGKSSMCKVSSPRGHLGDREGSQGRTGMKRAGIQRTPGGQRWICPGTRAYLIILLSRSFGAESVLNERSWLKKGAYRDFPGSPMVRTPCFHCKGSQVPSLLRELRSSMPFSTAKKRVYAL